MNVGGEFTVDAPRDEMFTVLRDAHSFVRFVDGVHGPEQIDPNCYQTAFETKVAYMKSKFAVTIEITQIQEPSVIAASIDGKPLDLVGRLTAKSLTVLQDAGATTKYSVEVTLAGTLGSTGQPVLRAKAKDRLHELAERLRASFAPAARGTMVAP